MKHLFRFNTIEEFNKEKDNLPDSCLCYFMWDGTVHYGDEFRNEVTKTEPVCMIEAVYHIGDADEPVSLTYAGGWNNVARVEVISPDGTMFDLSYGDLVRCDTVYGSNEAYYGYMFDSVGDYTIRFEMKVPKITCRMFCGIPYIKSIDIPSCIVEIDDDAFTGCDALDK